MMTVTDQTIIAIIALLIMCLPVIKYIIRFIRQRSHAQVQQETPVPLEQIPGLLIGDLTSLEDGVFYAAVSTYRLVLQRSMLRS